MEQTDTESGCRYGGTAAGRRASGAETFFSSAFAGKEDADTRWRPNGDVCHWQKGIPPAPDVQALESKSRGCRRRDTGESCPQTFREQEFQQRGSRGEAKRQSGGVWERRLLDGNVETDRRTETDESKLQCMRGWQRQSGRKESSLAQTPPRATDSASMAAVNDCEKRSNAEDLSDTWGEVPFENLSEASLDTALEVYVHSSKGMGKHEGKTKKSDGIRIKPTTPSFEWLGGVAQRVEGSFNFFTSTFADFALRAEELLGERTAPPRAFAAETGEASAVRAAPHHEARFLKNQTEARKIDAEVCGETAVAPLFAESAFAGTQRQVGFLSIETPDKQAKHEDLLHKDKESEQEERRRDHEREWTSFRVGALDGEASPTHRCDGKQETPGKTPEKLPHGRETREESFFDSSERRRQSWSSVVHPQVLDSPASVHAAVSACDIFPRSEPTRLHSFSSPSSGASDSPGPLLPSPIAASPSPSTSVLPHSLLFPEDRSDSLSPARRDRRGWGAEAVCVSQAHRRQLLLAASRFAASAETQPTEGSSDTQNTKHEETLESARTQAHAAFLPLTSPLFTEEELTVWSSTKCGLCGQQVLQEDLASHSAICNVAASADEYSVIHEDKFLASASALPEEDRRNYVAERRLEEALEGLCLVRRWGCGESSEDCLRRLQSSLEEKLKEGLLELRLPALWTDPSFDHPRLYCGRPPGPITNKSLLDVKGKIVAGRQRGLNADYLILDASAWTFLHQRYGGGPPIILYNPNPCEFGDLYEGCFVTFEGEWQNGHPYTGKGKVFDPLCNRGFDGELREGRLWNVKPGSKGLLPDGGILLGGACIQGKIHGPNGKLLRRRKLYVGKFRKGKLHGHGLVARAEDGVVLAEGVWENGKLCGI